MAVKIYRGTTRGYDSHTLAYYEGGRRVRRTFNTLAEAKTEAEIVATRLDQADAFALQLTGADRQQYPDRQQYLLAKAELQPLDIPLHLAIKEFVTARKLLSEGTLVDAARLHRAHTDPSRPKWSVEALVTECLEAKAGDNLSKPYLAQLRSDLGRFARDFKKNAADVTSFEIDAWLRGLRYNGQPVSGRTRNNVRTSVTTLFSFVKQPKNMPTEAESVQKAKVVEDETQILTAGQMHKLLAASDGYVRAHLAIAAFAMLRTAELARLRWESIDLSENVITVNAALAKVSRRRLVPIPENLKAWLQPLVSHGPVLPNGEVYREVSALAIGVGIKWTKNYLRNSAISYRLAVVQDTAQVAYEAGTSARVIFTNYRQLATPTQGKAWFSIVP